MFLFKGPQQMGIDMDLHLIEQYIRTQPFVDIQADYRKLPVGDWPKGILINPAN